MSNLLLYTLIMMGLTFLIGFFVAGVIKIIANWADFLDFYHTYHKEIIGMKQASKQEALAISSPFLFIQKNRLHREYKKIAHIINGLSHRKRRAMA